jgi:SAM-dependent methyltransferase
MSMDPYKFSAIAHRDHDWCNPVSAERMRALLRIARLDAQSRVLDLGCGKGELGLVVAADYGAQVVAVDRSVPMLDAARERARQRGLASRIAFVEQDIGAFSALPASFDLAVLMGAGGIDGGVEGICARLASWTRPGGHVLVGEGYWQRTPDAEYVEILGGDDLRDHAGNVQAGVAAGLVPVHAITASLEEWDEYEWMYARGIERYAREHPHDPDVPAMLERIRNWRDAYLRWGRGTLGFGCYLFLRP